MERLGFGYETVHAAHPRVIYLSCPAYPDGHRYAQRPGYDALVQASSGQMWEQPGWRMGPIFLHMPMPLDGRVLPDLHRRAHRADRAREHRTTAST